MSNRVEDSVDCSTLDDEYSQDDDFCSSSEDESLCAKEYLKPRLHQTNVELSSTNGKCLQNKHQLNHLEQHTGGAIKHNISRNCSPNCNLQVYLDVAKQNTLNQTKPENSSKRIPQNQFPSKYTKKNNKANESQLPVHKSGIDNDMNVDENKICNKPIRGPMLDKTVSFSGSNLLLKPVLQSGNVKLLNSSKAMRNNCKISDVPQQKQKSTSKMQNRMDISEKKSDPKERKDSRAKIFKRELEKNEKAKANSEKKKRRARFSHARLEMLSQPRSLSSISSSRKTCKDVGKNKNIKSHHLSSKKHQLFLERMEAAQRTRKEKIERTILETHYITKVDKKRCISCGNPQSYDEMINGRDICPNNRCKGRQYCLPTKFKIDDFQNRMKRSSNRRQEQLDKVMKERTTGKQIPKSRRQRELLNKVSENGKDFMCRMSDDIVSRKEKISRLGEEKQRQIDKLCPFQPKINVPNIFLRSRQKSLVSERYRNEKERLKTESLQKQKKTRTKRTSKKRRNNSKKVGMDKVVDECLAQKFKSLLL